MASRCAVCRHAEVLTIEKLHSAGMSFDRLGERFGLHPMAIFRHWTRHVSAERKASFALGPEQLRDLCETVAEEGGARLDYLKLLRRYFMTAVDRENEKGNTIAMVAAGKGLRDVLDDIGRLQGEVLRTVPNFSLTLNQTFFDDPRFAMMQSGLIEIGRESPEILPRIIALMERIDRASGPLIEGEANAA